MDTEGKMSVEAPASLGFDHRTVQLLALDNPGLLMVEEGNVNLSTAAKGDLQKPDEEILTMSGEGENYSVADANVYPVLMDFEKTWLWNRNGNLKVDIRMEDPDYMKKMLMEWVHAVAAYVRFLHASADIT